MSDHTKEVARVSVSIALHSRIMEILRERKPAPAKIMVTKDDVEFLNGVILGAKHDPYTRMDAHNLLRLLEEWGDERIHIDIIEEDANGQG